MTALLESKQFVELHARHMGLASKTISGLLGRVTTLDGSGAGSWVSIFSEEAKDADRRGDIQGAANLYNLARFPIADNPEKREAAALAARTLAAWLAVRKRGERRIARVGEIEVPFLFRDTGRTEAGLVVLMGGIVSLKEQWGGFLALARKIGCAVAIADFPGVGENVLRYERNAAALFGAIMDAASDACDPARTLIVAPSFGGQLAMLHAAQDQRVKEIVTIGAPLREFFMGLASSADVPLITRLALASSMRIEETALAVSAPALALSADEIARIQVPITYVAASRDEIIPESEWRNAAKATSSVRLCVFDDVHGAPNHLREVRLLILSRLLRHAGRARLGSLVERISKMRSWRHRTSLHLKTA